MPKKVSSKVRPPRISEAEFQRQVVRLATLLGWLAYHTRLSIWSASGYPDLTLVRGGRLILAELKREGGKTTAEQDRWLEALRRTPCEVYLWRPSQWSEIEEKLR